MLSATAYTAISRLEQAGYDAYAVGGCVRDRLRGVYADDVDITTSALPEQVMAVFHNERTIPTGLAHGTVTVLLQNEPVEITTFRRDGRYTDSRHPDEVSFTASLEEDLARRDFTINAMAYHPQKGVIDPFGGQEDLKNGILRCVGDPQKRFKEDALRIARWLRFMSVLNFKTDPLTAKAAFEQRHRLQAIAAERKRVEWMKTMMGPGFLSVAAAYPDVVCEIVPALRPLCGFDQKTPYHDYDVYTHSLRAVHAAPNDPVVKLAALFHDIGKPDTFFTDEQGLGHFYDHATIGAKKAKEALYALQFDKATVNAVLPLITYHHLELHADRRSVRRWMARLGEDGLRRLLTLKEADAAACKADSRLPDHSALYAMIDTILQEQDCLTRTSLAVNGRDLMALGIPCGPAVGEMLDVLLEAVLSDTCVNDKEMLLSLAKERWRS